MCSDTVAKSREPIMSDQIAVPCIRCGTLQCWLLLPDRLSSRTFPTRVVHRRECELFDLLEASSSSDVRA